MTIRKQFNAALSEAETQRELERLEHDMKVARSIQQSLLPSTTDGFRAPRAHTTSDLNAPCPSVDVNRGQKAKLLAAPINKHRRLIES